MSEQEVLRTIDQLLDSFRTPAVMVHRPYPPLGLSPMCSRLGGLPSLPDACEWPSGRSDIGKDVPLHFLAQIDCAELPEIDKAMPKKGMLFFFGRDDEEQLWGDTEHQGDVRVVYAPKVAPDQRLRPAPAALPPIRGDFFRGSPWPLPGELAPNVHAAWPVALLRIDSWPDVSAILETDLYRRAVLSARPHFEETGRLQKVSETSPRAAIDAFDKARQPFDELYDHRLNALRTGAIVSATGNKPPARARPDWFSGFKEAAKLAFDPGLASRPFPQVALMIDRMARLIVIEATSLLAHRDYQDQDKQQPLARAEQAGRYWINRCKEIGLEATPSQSDIKGFTDWLKQLSSDPTIASAGSGLHSPYLRGRMNNQFLKAMLSTIQYAAGSPKVAALIPASFYEAFDERHLPFAFGKLQQGILQPEFHQMLGHDRSCQDARAVDSDAVLLLQLCYDDVLNIRFGDVGSASFWIGRSDLEQRRFESAWGEVVGH